MPEDSGRDKDRDDTQESLSLAARLYWLIADTPRPVRNLYAGMAAIGVTVIGLVAYQYVQTRYGDNVVEDAVTWIAYVAGGGVALLLIFAWVRMLRGE